MPAANYDFTIEQGASLQKTFTLRDGDSVPVNLTGSTLQGQMRHKTSDASPVGSFTFTLANQTTNPGEFTLSMTATQTAALPSGPQYGAKRQSTLFAYDVERVVGSNVERILEGIVTLIPEATK